MTLDSAARRLRQDPREPAFFADPYALYARLHAECPVVFWEDYGFWCLSRFEDVGAALRDRRLGRQILHVATRAELGWPEPAPHLAPFDAVERHSLLELEPPEHTRLRGLVNRAFVSRAIERLRPGLVKLAHELVDSFEPAGEVELIEAYATPIPVLTIAALIGVPAERAEDLLAWSHAMVAMYQFGRTRAVEEAAVAAAEAFSAFLRGEIARRRREPGDDLISGLIAAAEGGARLSDDELIATLILLLNAGHEATVHALGNGIHALLTHGGRHAVAEDVTAVVEEMLRFAPPLHLFTRYALEDMEFAGVHLRKGDRLGLLLAAAGRDPARHAEPEVFRPTRPDAAHLAFGAGIHFCLGAPLARMEMAVALQVLFQRLPALRHAPGTPPRLRDSFHFHGLEELRLVW